MAEIEIDVAGVAALLAARAQPARPLIVGLTGSVAAGKSVLSAALVTALAASHRVDSVSTDGFLFDNATLDARGLTLRKGFPESYDSAALAARLADVRTGPARFPGYSHISYDVDPALARTIDRPDILIVEGLGLAPVPGASAVADALDTLIYLDALEADLEHWFVMRFLDFWRRAEHDPASFYAQFRGLDEAGAAQFARSVWTRINLPNLRDHIILARDRADLVLAKSRDHRLTLVRNRHG